MAETLQDLRKKKFHTVKDFAVAWGTSPSTASLMLNGKHHMTLSKKDVQRLADLFEVSFDKCTSAADASFWTTHSGNSATRDYWSIKNRWEREDDLQSGYQQWKARGGKDRILFTLEGLDALAPFNLSSGATEEDIKKAFREKVKLMADGKGGYKGDMDVLVQAKEKALVYVRGSK